MSMLKEILIEEIFEFPSIKGITQKFINDNKGDIPVYGGKKSGIAIGYVKDNLEDVKYFEDCLTWNIDGSIACFYREGKFSLSEKVIPIYLKEEYKDLVDLEYLSYLLREKAIEHGFSREFKPNQSKLRNISISIPIKEDGSFDLENQKEIASRYEKIENIKSSLKDKMNMLVDSDVLID